MAPAPGNPSTRAIAGLERPLPRIGLGTTSVSVARRDATFATLDAFVELGGTLIDTAAVYGDSEAEQVIGAWLAARPESARTVSILTKGAHPGADWRSRMTPEAIAADLASSLERLGVSQVAALMVHRDDEAVPVGEILDALDEQVRAGRTRAIGVSNWRLARLEAAAAWTRSHDTAPLALSSSYLGLAQAGEFPWRGCVSARDPETLAWHARTGIPLVAWSAQSGGFFSDTFDPAAILPDLVRTYDTAANRARRERAQRLGAGRGATAAQVALAWVLEEPSAPIALAGARDPAWIRTMWAALDLRLTAADRTWLDTGIRPEG